MHTLTRRLLPWIFVAATLSLLGACATGVRTGETQAGIRFVEPSSGAKVTGSRVALTVDTTNITLVPMGKSGDAAPGTLPGHFHVVVDGTDIGMASATSGMTIDNLANGIHTILVQLYAPNHLPYEPPVESSIEVEVVGSSATGRPQLSGGDIGR